MPIVTRLSRLLRADLHAVLDRLEEPDALLRQALREMEESLAADRATLATLRAQRDRLDARSARLERRLAALAGELEVCLEAGQDDLARAVIRRRLEAERLRDVLDRRRRALAAETTGLEGRLRERSARLEAMRAQAGATTGEDAGDEAVGAFPDAAAAPVTEDEVEVALLAEKRRRERGR